MHRLIGLLGVKGAGKDTAATLLVHRLGFVRIGFADALYREVAEAFGVSIEFLSRRETKESPLPELALERCRNPDFIEVARASGTVLQARSPRWILQVWGTEYRRRSRFGWDSYWLDQVAARIDAHPEQRFVVTDVRFSNEATFVEQRNGLLLRIRRPVLEDLEAQARAAGDPTALHPSATQLLDRDVGAEAVNEEGDPESLLRGLTRILPELGARAA